MDSFWDSVTRVPDSDKAGLVTTAPVGHHCPSTPQPGLAVLYTTPVCTNCVFPFQPEQNLCPDHCCTLVTFPGTANHISHPSDSPSAQGLDIGTLPWGRGEAGTPVSWPFLGGLPGTRTLSVSKHLTPSTSTPVACVPQVQGSGLRPPWVPTSSLDPNPSS